MSRAWRNGSTRAWRRLRLAVLERDGWRCRVMVNGQVCNVRATHADHIVPRSQGGTDVMDNLRAACAQHNLARGGRLDYPTNVRPSWTW